MTEKAYELTISHPPHLQLQYELAPSDTLTEIRNILIENTLLFIFQQFTLRYHGRRLSEVVEVSSLGLQQKSQIDVVLMPLEERSARNHVLKVNELLKNPKLATHLLNTSSALLTRSISLTKKMAEEIENHVRFDDCMEIPLEGILHPAVSNRLLELESQSDKDCPPTLTFMSFSGYNPPPDRFRMQGNFFYLNVRTLESIDYHVTACTRGFYINNSNSCHFDPTQHPLHKKTFYCLIDLLKSVSLKFKEGYDKLTNIVLTESDRVKLTKTFPFQLTNPRWLASYSCHSQTWNPMREHSAEKMRDQVLMVPIKDWNQLFLAQKEMSAMNVVQQMNRSKFSTKLYTEYIQAAAEGAMKVVNRNLVPLNPAESEYEQIFVNNNMFFSTAKQNPLSFEQERGVNACSSASGANVDLRNLAILHKHPIEGLNPLETVIVDYKGSRILAQSIIPGILTSVQCCQYGSMDDGKTISANPEFESSFKKVCDLFKLQDSIEYLNGEGQTVKLAGSIDVKGILGSDKKKYLVDLLRLSVRDLNYPGKQNTACMIRQQLIDLYITSQTSTDSEYQELLDKANEISVPIRFNPAIDTCSPLAESKHAGEQVERLKKLAAFIRERAIPQLVGQLREQVNFMKLADSLSVAKLFHKCGVNMRYLGEVYRYQGLQKHLRMILERVILVKSMKHLFRKIMRTSPKENLLENLVHALNALFAAPSDLKVMEEGVCEEEKPAPVGKKKQKKKKAVPLQEDYELMAKDIAIQPNPYGVAKPSQLWQEMRVIAKARYSHQLSESAIEYEGFKLPFNKIAALRDLCISVGIVLTRQDYGLMEDTRKQQLPFSLYSIVEIVPIVKHLDLSIGQVTTQIQQGERLFSQFKIEKSIEHFQQALHILITIYGGVHKDMAGIYSRIGLIHYRLGDYSTAIFYEHSAFIILRMIYQEDHPEVAVSLFNLGLYHFTAGDHKKALFLTQKSIFLSNLVGGQYYPESILTFMNLSTIYQTLKNHQTAISVLLQVKERITMIYPLSNYNHAACHQALAAAHYEIGDLLKAVHFQERSCEMIKQVMGIQHTRYKESSALLARFQEEINFQRQASEQKPKAKRGKREVKESESPGRAQKNALLDKLKSTLENYQVSRQAGLQPMRLNRR